MRISDWNSDGCSSDLVDQIERRIAAVDFLGRDQQIGETVLGGLVRGARGNLLAGGEHHFAGLGIDDVVGRLDAAPVLGRERNLPAALPAPISDAVEIGRATCRERGCKYV